MKMKKSVLASLYHCVMIEDEEVRHQYCPEDSWCAFKRGEPVEEKDHHLVQDFLDILLPVYQYYTALPMLQKLVPGFTTNSIECFNSVLWNRMHKHKFHGATRLKLG